MDAKSRNVTVFLVLFFTCRLAGAATYSTANFVATAPTPELAEKVAKCAEVWREDLAIQWLGRKLPNWYKPCPITVKVGQIGAGGATTFTFDNGEVYGWKMKVQGTEERILDSVIPHEVNHTIFASYFRRPLPRWADEGAATLFEHRSEQLRQLQTLNRVVKSSRRIPLAQLLEMREYPDDMEDVLTLYAEGFSLASFLMREKGENARVVYLSFLQDAHQFGWKKSIKKHYGFETVSALEKDWTNWVLAGSPSQIQNPESIIAANTSSENSANEEVIRLQSPPPLEPLDMIPRQLRGKPAADVGRATQKSAPQTAQDNWKHGAPEQIQGAVIKSGDNKLNAPPLARTNLTPTNDGINSDPRSYSYQFPQMRAF